MKFANSSALTLQSLIKVLSCPVQTLYSQGILTIVDMHQDFYSRWLNKGCGEGFPKWSILVPSLLLKYPLNGPTCIAWILQVCSLPVRLT